MPSIAKHSMRSSSQTLAALALFTQRVQAFLSCLKYRLHGHVRIVATILLHNSLRPPKRLVKKPRIPKTLTEHSEDVLELIKQDRSVHLGGTRVQDRRDGAIEKNLGARVWISHGAAWPELEAGTLGRSQLRSVN